MLTPKDKEETSEDSITDPEEGKETDTEKEREEPGENADWEWQTDYDDWDYVRDYRVKTSDLGPSLPCKWRRGRSYTPDGWKRRYKYKKVKKMTTVDPTDCLFKF